MGNPRYANGALRRRYREYFKAQELPCAICGRPIDYSQPHYVLDEQGRKHVNMQSFVIDERIPVSKYWVGGYASKEAAAKDLNNLQPVHAMCNAKKGNKLNFKAGGRGADQAKNASEKAKNIRLDGEW